MHQQAIEALDWQTVGRLVTTFVTRRRMGFGQPVATLLSALWGRQYQASAEATDQIAVTKPLASRDPLRSLDATLAVFLLVCVGLLLVCHPISLSAVAAGVLASLAALMLTFGAGVPALDISRWSLRLIADSELQNEQLQEVLRRQSDPSEVLEALREPQHELRKEFDAQRQSKPREEVGDEFGTRVYSVQTIFCRTEVSIQGETCRVTWGQVARAPFWLQVDMKHLAERRRRQSRPSGGNNAVSSWGLPRGIPAPFLALDHMFLQLSGLHEHAELCVAVAGPYTVLDVKMGGTP